MILTCSRVGLQRQPETNELLCSSSLPCREERNAVGSILSSLWSAPSARRWPGAHLVPPRTGGGVLPKPGAEPAGLLGCRSDHTSFNSRISDKAVTLTSLSGTPASVHVNKLRLSNGSVLSRAAESRSPEVPESSYLNHLQGWPCSSPVRAQQRGRHCWLEKRVCDGFPICACRLTPKLGGVSARSALEKEFWKKPLMYQWLSREVKTTCLRQFSRSRSPGKALEGLMLQLWVGTRNLYFKKLSLCYSGTGRDTRRRGSAQNWGVAGRPLDSYSSAKKSVTEALKVTVRFQARLSRPRLTAHI